MMFIPLSLSNIYTIEYLYNHSLNNDIYNFNNFDYALHAPYSSQPLAALSEVKFELLEWHLKNYLNYQGACYIKNENQSRPLWRKIKNNIKSQIQFQTLNLSWIIIEDWMKILVGMKKVAVRHRITKKYIKQCLL